MPRFFISLLVEEVRKRQFVWHNPYNGQRRELVLAPDQHAVLVLWSKDFGPFLARADAFAGWPLFFHFTINNPSRVLEPDLPDLDQRLSQMQRLVQRWGSRAVRWRFDPVAVWEHEGKVLSNICGIEHLAGHIRAMGIQDVTISFMDQYRKIERRTKSAGLGITFRYPDSGEQRELLLSPCEMLADMGFSIHTCCEPDLAASGLAGVRPGRCIDAELLSEISGLDFLPEPDRGQRRSQGCLCHRSIDIGCYTHHRCPGQCLYCYARP